MLSVSASAIEGRNRTGYIQTVLAEGKQLKKAKRKKRRKMIHFEREVTEHEIIEAMLDMFQDTVLSLNGEDGYPYSVPVNYGYEADEEEIVFYIHFMKKGHKLDLMRRDPRVTLQFHQFNDFPDRPYKGHKHDYRSVTAKGTIEVIDVHENYEEFEKGYLLLLGCNGRPLKLLKERNKPLPNIYIGKITCPWSMITAKSEFPLRIPEDVPFINVYEVEEDLTPFDIRDIVEKRRKGL